MGVRNLPTRPRSLRIHRHINGAQRSLRASRSTELGRSHTRGSRAAQRNAERPGHPLSAIRTRLKSRRDALSNGVSIGHGKLEGAQQFTAPQGNGEWDANKLDTRHRGAPLPVGRTQHLIHPVGSSGTARRQDPAPSCCHMPLGRMLRVSRKAAFWLTMSMATVKQSLSCSPRLRRPARAARAVPSYV
jgi:hypothetical protein